MIQFVQAGFGEVIPDAIHDKALYVAHGIRHGPAVNDEHGWIQKIVADAAQHRQAIFLVAGWLWRDSTGTLYHRSDYDIINELANHFANQCESIIIEWRRRGAPDWACWIEFGGELDGGFWKKRLKDYHRAAMAAYERVRFLSKEVRFITGSVMNFNRARFCWQKAGYEVLRDLCKLDWPIDTLQGLHPYRNECAQDEWPSWKSRDEMMEKLRLVLRGRDVAITEMGWHSKSDHSDEAIARYVRDEIEMWRAFRAACYCHYQIQDGPQPQNFGEGGFGAFTNLADGLEPKPVAEVLHEALVPRAT